MNSKTILVSNRLPIEFKITSRKIEATPSVGGLATGLKSVHAQGDSLWIGWSGLTEEQVRDRRQIVADAASEYRCVTVPLSQRDIDDYYLGFSNRSLWPLFHYFLEYTEYSPEQWESYVAVNNKFADVILEHAGDNDQIWIHDYQLLLLPKILREKRPSLSIGFFLHIPFPAFEIFRTCPWREELLSGMLGADLIGFHTYDYVQHFLNSAKRILGLTVKFDSINNGNRYTRVDSFPMGIDYGSFNTTAHEHLRLPEREKSEVTVRLSEHLAHHPESKLILSIDRMDYTKGIPNRIRAFAYFLEKYPQFREKVRLVMLTVPSRSNVPQYHRLKKATDELVGRINGKYGTIDWTPIWYFYRSMPFDELIDLYAFSHVALVTPLRDGMNLVAKEYVATRTNRDGVLILSEMAGAAAEMHEAILINPNNANEFADALKQALEMPVGEQQSRMKSLQQRVSRYTVDKWAQDFLDSLARTILPTSGNRCKKITPAIIDEMTKSYRHAKSRLLLLDYDGTLVKFCTNPDDACPDNSLYELLDKIHAQGNTEIVIISGRGRDSIEKWFGDKPYTLVTDHGVWMRRADSGWEQLEYPATQWKQTLRPILENFVDRTPGSFIEEKQYSLAWHYRRADADLSEVRKRELVSLLTGMIADNDLALLEGNKVLEIKNAVVNKGRAASRLVAATQADFVFAAGDDHTDEFLFAALPETAFTVKVGSVETCAKYYVGELEALREMLGNLKI